MGGGSWSNDAYKHITRTYASKSKDEIFVAKTINNDMSPIGVDLRESRDSDEHPESLAVAVFLDVTGSMGRIPEVLVKEKLGPLMETLIKHGVKHPQIMFGAIGDQYTDRAPLQVSQFESETSLIDKWLTSIYLEGNGGGQGYESYPLAWLFASRFTSIDCLKRKEKGFLFTIGDEAPWNKIGSEELEKILGKDNIVLKSVDNEGNISAKDLLREVQKTYHVFHIHINEASYKNSSSVFDPWKELLGERFLILDDYNAIGELISSTVSVINGIDLKKITSDFDSKTAALVTNALATVSKSSIVKSSDKEGIVSL